MTNLRLGVETIVEEAWRESPLARAALCAHYDYNTAIYQEQRALINAISQATDIDVDILHSKVLASLDRDIAITQQLNTAIAHHDDSNNATLTYAFKTNKMEKVLGGAKSLLTEHNEFSAILSGDFPTGFGDMPPFPVIIAESGSPFGSSDNTYLSAALLSIWSQVSTVQDEERQPALMRVPNWVDESAIAHVTPVPETFFETNPALLAQFLDEYTFGYSDEHTPTGLLYPHSGYAFGGYRDESRYAEQQKIYGPEDCSSWIAKISGSPIAFSTIDMLYCYRSLSENNQGYFDPDWLSSDVAQTMSELFNPIEVTSLADIHPGQIMSFRAFNSGNHADSAGYSGHTVLVLGVDDYDQIVALNYTREMPREGFGISLFDYHSNDNREVFFLEPKAPTLALSDILDGQQPALPHDFSTAPPTLLPCQLMAANEYWHAEVLPPLMNDDVLVI